MILKKGHKIQVTRAIRPRFLHFIIRYFIIQHSRYFTNFGKYEKQLERKLKERFSCKHVVLMSNGTMPLVFLMSQLPPNSKVITTPYSFIATTSAILQMGHKPIFVDIDPDTLTLKLPETLDCINSNEIAAILLTQVYGRIEMCKSLEDVARSKGIPIYFDSSHSFDVFDESGKSAYLFGDATTASFHSTKLFSTVEGGAIFTNNEELANAARNWMNFGYSNGQIVQVGINAKMSELSASFGLGVLKRIRRESMRRNRLYCYYRAQLSGLSELKWIDSPNYSYFPVMFPTTHLREKVIEKLELHNIFPRRYFSPSLDEVLSELNMEVDACPNSRNVSSRVLCLPLGDDVTKKTIEIVAHVIRQVC